MTRNFVIIFHLQPAAPNHALKISTNRNHVQELMTEFAQVIKNSVIFKSPPLSRTVWRGINLLIAK